MPCTKCEEGKYKWGETGECKYDTLESCESANHKYNKMRPTPLGKKSYEEYEKELKEYNLSSQRFDFNDIKTIEKLVGQLDKNGEQLQKAAATVNEKFKIVEKTGKEYQAIDDQVDKIRAEQDKLGNIYEKQESDWSKSQDKLGQIEGDAPWRELEAAIESVESQAKALGITKIPVTAQAKKALSKWDSIKDKADKIYRQNVS